jgi:hypothetical protein
MARRNPSIVVTPGETFGRLTVVRETRNNGRRAVVVNCECGTQEKEINLAALTSGSVTSCGCLRRELPAQRAHAPVTTNYGRVYHVDENGRECAGKYCDNTYKPWSEFNKGNSARGYNSWCRDCTKTHYRSKRVI